MTEEEQMTEHEVLVKTRNSIAHEGYNVMTYGTYHEGCGEPRCVLGWCGLHAGMNVRLGVRSEDHNFYDYNDPVYVKAMQALWETRPVEVPRTASPTYGFASAVEEVAYRLRRLARQKQLGDELEAVLAWFDAAIARTAPEPELPQLEAIDEEIHA
jgi:hypothetical protein